MLSMPLTARHSPPASRMVVQAIDDTFVLEPDPLGTGFLLKR
jgi:hypothetical protein